MTQHILFILGLVLGGSILFTLFHMLIRQFRRRIDIRIYSKGGKPLESIAYVKHSKGKEAEAFLPKDAQKVVGRIKIDKFKQKAIVQLRQSRLDDDTPDPIFKRCGYVDEEGYIYKQLAKDGPVERVGYVARPDKPDVPCLDGKRSWKTLWMHAFLDVYQFKKSFVEKYDKEPVSNLNASGEETPQVRRDQSGLSLEEILEDIKSHMVRVEGGTFMMGAAPKEDGVKDEDGKTRGMVEENESPQHEVTLSDFCISRFPVTQAEWKAVMGENPSDCKDDLNYPVSPVSWDQCQQFIQKLNELTGMSFSLPNEAQWEFAAKGGNLGNNTTFSGSNRFSEVGWGDHKHAVGLKAPNELGLYDMSGLVREWCADLWGRYGSEPQTDPVGPEEDSPLVIKNVDGGLFRAVRSPSGNETVTNRKGEDPSLDKDFKSYGIRLVCTPTEAVPEPVSVPAEAPAAMTGNLSEKAEMIARCDLQGFGFPKENAITSESRAGAYALFAYNDPTKYEYEEFFSEPRYGWKDTALLAAAVYAVIYFLYYLVNTSILQRPLVGMMGMGVPVLYGFYYVIWCLLRSIKIERAESGNSFQPQLDLLNKTLGQQGFENITLALCAAAIPLSRFIFDLDFYPLLMAISTGLIINRTVPDVASAWNVKKSFTDRPANEPEEDENSEQETNQPPAGEMMCTYDWDLDYDGRSLHGNLSIRFESDLIHEERQNNPFFSQNSLKPMSVVKNMFEMLLRRRDYMERTRFLARYINDTASRTDLPEHIKLQFALDFIQEPNIRFVLDKNSERIQNSLEYMRLPDETLYDKEGDYDCKAFFAAMLFYSMGYDVLFLYSSKHERYAIAVEERYQWTESIWADDARRFKIPYLDQKTLVEKNFVLCETVADHFKVGELLQGVEADDFDQKELFVQPTKAAIMQGIVYKHFDWDLEKQDGSANVHGMLVLSLNESNIDDLRSNNPFRKDTEVDDSALVDRMIALLTSKDKYVANLSEAASVIKGKIPDAGLEQIQFALNFTLEPNIRFQANENSEPIGFASHYLRYPDELLFDKEADNNSKAFFAAMVLFVLGYDVKLLRSETDRNWIIAVQTQEMVLCSFTPDNRLIAEPADDDLSGYSVVSEITKRKDE